MNRNSSQFPPRLVLPVHPFHKSDPFLETSPRPPVPGAEESISEGVGGPQNSIFRHYPMQGDATPRKSLLAGNGHLPSPYSDAPNGFEPDGCSTGSRGYRETPPPPDRSPPSYLQWAQKLSSLLEDRQGVELFKKYVEQEGGVHADRLNFYFACEGLKKQTNPGKVKQLVGAIYRFLRKSQLSIPEDLRRRVKLGLKDDKDVRADVYDPMQAEVERLINDTTYPNFLRSELYLSHVQAMQSCPGNYPDASDTCSSSSSGSAQFLSCTQSVSALPTLHEDLELGGDENSLQSSNEQSGINPPRLTKDLLMATQRRRLDQRPKHESFTGLLSRGYSVYSHPHAAYSSYNPVSRQDSEQQSMSSGRTDSDTMSMSGSSVDGIPIGNRMHHSSRHHLRHNRAIRESAQLNRDPNVHDMVIPRTQRVQKEQCLPMDPAKFAAILMSKLEIVRRDQEIKEKLDRNILESGDSLGENGYPGQQRALADALRERLQLDDDNDQDILDQHVSRVWSDLTPSRTPRGFNTPPVQSLHHVGPSGSKISDHHHHTKQSAHRDRVDVFSTFSGDSGNVQDYHDFSTSANTTMSKSHSMPDYNDVGFNRYNIARRSASKKTLTDLTDSGVSVMSGSMPMPTSVNLGTRARESRVISWLMEGGQPQQAERYRKSFSRSSSSERYPAHSHVSSERDRSHRYDCQSNASSSTTDPNMPLLEEARRRLIEEEKQGRHPKQRFSSKPEPASAQSTLRRPVKRSSLPSNNPVATASTSEIVPPPAISASTEHTIVVFSFCDEKFPYRTKIPGTMITLKQFKEILPKKGTYRYFFKTECEELENQVIQEEIFNDADMLPLWEGKIMAQVKPCEQSMPQ